MVFTFSSGLRVLYRNTPHTHITHAAMVLDVGSRHEPAGQEGVAHFLEHMVFKGTTRRKSFHILSLLDNEGGELNAYTTKDRTCLYASVLSHATQKALDVLFDTTFHSVFPEKEMEKEKQVVKDEMNMYLDNPEERIFDEFLELAFPNHPLGWNILGTEASLQSLTRDQLVAFTQVHYQPAKAVLAVFSPIAWDKIQAWIEPMQKDLGPWQPAPPPLAAPEPHIFQKTFDHDFTQAHALLGFPAFGINHPKRFTLALLNNLLGGPGMNSRLNLRIREKYGYCYTINSDLSQYTETGFINIYFGCDAMHFERVLKLVDRELEELCEVTLNQRSLDQARRQLKGQIAMAEEHRSSLAIALARNLQDRGKEDSLEELFAQLDAVTPADFLEVAQELFHPSKRMMLSYLPQA